MSSQLLTPKERIAEAIRAVPKNRKRDKSEGPLIVALLIGAFAAAGIIIVATSEPDVRLSSGEPATQGDTQK